MLSDTSFTDSEYLRDRASKPRRQGDYQYNCLDSTKSRDLLLSPQKKGLKSFDADFDEGITEESHVPFEDQSTKKPFHEYAVPRRPSNRNN